MRRNTPITHLKKWAKKNLETQQTAQKRGKYDSNIEKGWTISPMIKWLQIKVMVKCHFSTIKPVKTWNSDNILYFGQWQKKGYIFREQNLAIFGNTRYTCTFWPGNPTSVALPLDALIQMWSTPCKAPHYRPGCNGHKCGNDPAKGHRQSELWDFQITSKTLPLARMRSSFCRDAARCMRYTVSCKKQRAGQYAQQASFTRKGRKHTHTNVLHHICKKKPSSSGSTKT